MSASAELPEGSIISIEYVFDFRKSCEKVFVWYAVLAVESHFSTKTEYEVSKAGAVSCTVKFFSLSAAKTAQSDVTDGATTSRYSHSIPIHPRFSLHANPENFEVSVSKNGSDLVGSEKSKVPRGEKEIHPAFSLHAKPDTLSIRGFHVTVSIFGSYAAKP